ncbi:MAG TPA: CHASE domain-containing protein [Burkholderiaceae bacterium]|nr:CHASE domain-containing protein [Burkholderiaceae bacterium]
MTPTILQNPTPTRSEPWAVPLAATAIAYFVVAAGSLRLAIPPGYSTPLYPAAGIALACVLMYGPRMLIAVAFSAFVTNILASLQGPQLNPSTWALPLTTTLGATLQAWAGATLIRRFVRQPLTLTEPRDVTFFLGASVVSCLINATFATALLWYRGRAAASLPLTWGTWWIGDVLGVLIATPIVLTLFAKPREAWAPRRLSVGLTLVIVTVLLTLGILQVARWNRERISTAFERDASSASLAVSAQLREPLQALQALRGVYMASDDVTREELRIAVQPWLGSGSLRAMGWLERVRRADIPAFEARVRADGFADYRVFDRKEAADGGSIAAGDDEVAALRFIEPIDSNSTALGVNSRSIPAARRAIDEALRTGRPAATAGFRLTQQAAHERGVVVYQAVYHRAAGDTPNPDKAVGLVFVTLRLDQLMGELTPQIPAYLNLCLVDRGLVEPRQRLIGAPGCESQTSSYLNLRTLPYAGREWELRVSAKASAIPGANSADVWLFALVGLLSTAMLGGFLLTVTGRTRRIETAVQERTAALQAEVHEREVAEAALRESEQRFRTILNHVPIGVIYTDLRGNVKQTNPRFCEMTGYREDELLAMSATQYTHPEDVTQDEELTAQLVRGEIPMYRRHKRYVSKHGQTIWVQNTVSLLRDAQGQPRRILGVVEDITEHLKLEEAERAREAAEASNRAKSDFLSRMSHELRTPLNAMLGFAQLLELDVRHPLTPAQQPWVVQIQQAGWHLLEMINDVLDLSRIESGNLRLQTDTLHLADVLAASVSLIEGDAKRRRILILQELGDDTPNMLGDATRVKQILTNLLSNAVKYNVDGGRIHIASRREGIDQVEIAVTDTGLGMTADQMAELFQPFNRLGRERSTLEGTGIGLVISQRLAELMGGSLRAKSVAGKGSSFILSLPCAPNPATQPSGLDALAPSAADYHRRHIHYVEDNETNIEVMRGILAQRPQVELSVSITGLDGLAAVRQKLPDLILLDMHLPDISGMELLRHLKADRRTAGIPIVIVSADALANQIDAAFEAGASHYLTKPVNVSELLGVLDDLLERMDTAFS